MKCSGQVMALHYKNFVQNLVPSQNIQFSKNSCVGHTPILPSFNMLCMLIVLCLMVPTKGLSTRQNNVH